MLSFWEVCQEMMSLRQISNADMIVMPSLWEGLSIFQLEALALGCPMMLSDISAFRQIFMKKNLVIVNCLEYVNGVI